MIPQDLFHRWFVAYNPLYLLSTLCTLAGVFLISQGLNEDAGSHLALAGVVEAYQVLLIVAAGLLLRCGRTRPAVLLALLELLFLFDAPLNTERIASLGPGLFAASAVIATFAIAKLWTLVRMFRMKLPADDLFVLHAIFFLIAIGPYGVEWKGPGFSARLEMHLGLTWLGSLPLAWALLERRRHPMWSSGLGGSPAVTARLRAAMPLLVAAFSLGHLVAWSIYLSIPWTPAHLAPFALVAGTAVSLRLLRTRSRTLAEAAACCGALTAVVLSMMTHPQQRAVGGLFGLGPVPRTWMAFAGGLALSALMGGHRLRLALPAISFGVFGLLSLLYDAGVPVFPEPESALVFAVPLFAAASIWRSPSCLVGASVASGAAMALGIGMDGVRAGYTFCVYGAVFTAGLALSFPERRTWILPCIGVLTILEGFALFLDPELPGAVPVTYGTLSSLALVLAGAYRNPGFVLPGGGGWAALFVRFRGMWAPESTAGWGVLALISGFLLRAGGVLLNLLLHPAARNGGVLRE